MSNFNTFDRLLSRVFSVFALHPDLLRLFGHHSCRRVGHRTHIGRHVDGSTPSTWGMEFRSRIEDLRLGVLRTTDVGNSSDVGNMTYNTHALKVTSTAFYLHTVILIDPSTHPIFTHHMILLQPSYATNWSLEGMFSVVFEYFLEAGP